MRKKIQRAVEKYHGEMIYTASNCLRPAVGLVTSGIAAAFIDPERFGILQSVLIILPYFGFLHLGVINGLNRNIAFYKAQGKNEKVQSIVNTSYTLSLLISGIGFLTGSVIFVNAALRYGGFSDQALAALVLTAQLIFINQTMHFDTTYRSGQQFKVLGIIIFIENGANVVLGILPMFLGFLGKVIADTVRPVTAFVLRWRNQPIPARRDFRLADYKELMKVGFPLMVGGYLLGIFIVTDQSIIAVRLGAEQLGYYTLSRLLMTAVQIVPVSLGVLLYPRASACYGQTRSNKGLRPFFWKALLVNCSVLVPLCGILYFAIAPVTNTFLPKYTPGIVSAQINILTSLTFVCQGPSIIVGVVKRNLPLLAVTGLVIPGMWLFAWQFSVEQLSLEIIAWQCFFFSLALAVFTLVYSYWLTTRNEYDE